VSRKSPLHNVTASVFVPEKSVHDVSDNWQCAVPIKATEMIAKITHIEKELERETVIAEG
jgi:hypothetical protein